MDARSPQDEGMLRARLAQAQQRLRDLVQELRGVDAELEGLSDERRRHGLLGAACDALEELAGVGGAALFWGERAATGEGEQRIRAARGQLDAFGKRIGEIEERRDDLLEAIGRAEETAELLEDDVVELERREEQRRLEWVIEREIGPLPARATVMPWTRGGEDDERFRRSLAATLLASLLLGALIPMVQLPLPEPWEPIEVPERFARLIREERPPPPPVREQPAPPERTPEPTPERPQIVEETRPSPTPEPSEKPSPESKGILAFREKFSGLARTRTAARLGSQARITRSGEAASGYAQRALVTTQAAGSSGGINLAALSRDVGGGGDGDGQGIGGVEVARATSTIGGSGTSDRPRGGGPALSRTDEEIQIVFDRHKAALYRLYNRELRRDPTLQGQIVLRLRIEPDGSVSLCEVQGSDMRAPQLAAQVVERVRTFDFGAKDGIGPVTILYPIDFLPAT